MHGPATGQRRVPQPERVFETHVSLVEEVECEPRHRPVHGDEAARRRQRDIGRFQVLAAKADVGGDHVVKLRGKSKSKVKNEIELCQLSKLGLGYDKENESLIVISNSKSSYSSRDMPLELLNELIERVQ